MLARFGMPHAAVQRLRQLGYRIMRFEEGYPGWEAAGHNREKATLVAVWLLIARKLCS